ncbi:phosphatase PAP2 family protein [candidate division KSB1 bacterium]|nr:MAG: phosphatase PAP2 family protein [candidate division KSB1 bacterium]
MVKNLIENLNKFDTWLCVQISKWNGKKPVDRIMFGVSHFGYGYLYPAIIGLTAIFDRGNSAPIVRTGFAAFFIETLGQILLKLKLRRIRPFLTLPQIKSIVKAPDMFSFPSGHAAGAFVMATVFNHFYPSITIPLYSTASIIGFSRVYNGVHYPSDVIAGSFLGFISGRLGVMLML